MSGIAELLEEVVAERHRLVIGHALEVAFRRVEHEPLLHDLRRPVAAMLVPLPEPQQQRQHLLVVEQPPVSKEPTRAQPEQQESQVVLLQEHQPLPEVIVHVRFDGDGLVDDGPRLGDQRCLLHLTSVRLWALVTQPPQRLAHYELAGAAIAGVTL